MMRHRFTVAAWLAMVCVQSGCGGPARPVAPRGNDGFSSAGETITFRFDDLDEDQPPPGEWRTAAANIDATDLDWRIKRDAFTRSRPHVLALTRTSSVRKASNFCVLEGQVFRDVEVSARVNGDEGAGIALRLSADLNGYIVRVNPGEGNLRIYRIENGERSIAAETRLGFADDDGWYTMNVRLTGNHFDCTLKGETSQGKGQEVRLVADDDHFPNAGHFAVWTRANVKGRFDDIAITPLHKANGD